MKRLVNARPLVTVALSQIAGIAFAAYTPSLGVWAAIIPLSAVTIAGGVATVFAKDLFKRIATALLAVICILFAYLGGASIQKSVNSEKIASGEYEITGVVGYCSYSDGAYNIRLSDCSLDGKKCGNIAVYGVKRRFDRYDKIKFSGYAYSAAIEKNGRYSDYSFMRTAIIATANGSMEKVGVKVCLPYKFRKFVSDTLDAVGGKSKAVAFALVCGDTAMLKGRTEIFRASGIAHVFAVSGLHVGMLCALLSLLLKPFPVGKAVKSFVTTCVLFLYSLICGLSASSLRAAVMCSTYLLTSVAYEKRDGVSALALASIITLLFNPSDLFGIGFVLSFTLSLALITLAPPVAAKLSVWSDKLKSTASVLVAAELTTAPLCVKYFGSFPLISVVGNLVVVPAVTLAFYFTVAGLALSVILPANIALFPASALLAGAETVSSALSNVTLNINFFPDILLIVYFFFLFVASDLFNAGKTLKRICVTAIAFIFVATLFLSYVT